MVLGVNADYIASYQKFADKYGLTNPLLADADTSVSQLYGVWKEKNYSGKANMGVNRETFLIEKEGIVRKVWQDPTTSIHEKVVCGRVWYTK